MVDKSHLQQLTLQCRRILMDKSPHRMPIKEFQQLYIQYYSKPCNIEELKQNLSNVVQVRQNATLADNYHGKKNL